MRSAARDLRVPQESFVLAPSQQPPAEAQPGASSPPGRLVVRRSSVLRRGESFPAGPVPLTLGRSGENAVSLAGDEFASGRHARIESQRDGVWILDLGSTNGTFVNGERIDGRARLHEGDVVRIGETELILE